jgi:hypothetical protein
MTCRLARLVGKIVTGKEIERMVAEIRLGDILKWNSLELLLIALMMETARTSETLVNFYQTTQRYNPEDSHLHTHRRENLKSY